MDRAIVLYNPSVADQNKHSLQLNQEEVHKLISRIVLEKNNELKKLSSREKKSSEEAGQAIRVSYTSSEDAGSAEIQKRARNPTECIGELFTSFNLPNELLSAGNINEIVTSKNKSPRFSFSERLADWKLERKERHNGIHETYYRHTKSSKAFKSSRAVVNFILYEVYPENNNQKLKQITKQGDCSNTSMMMGDALEETLQETTWEADETRVVDDKEGFTISSSLHTHIVPAPCDSTPTPTVNVKNVLAFILSTFTEVEPFNIMVQKHPQILETIQDEWKIRMATIPLAYVSKLLKDGDGRDLVDEEFEAIRVALDAAESNGASVEWIRSEVEELRSNQEDRRFYEQVKALRDENKELENKLKANEEKIRELQTKRYRDFDEPIPKRMFLGGS